MLLEAMLNGARHARAALVCGVGLMLAAWIGWGDKFPSKADADDAWSRLHAASDFVGHVGTISALLVVAYLVGSLVLMMTESVASVSSTLGIRAWNRLFLPSAPKMGEKEDPRRLLIEELDRDIQRIPTRLLVASGDAYGEYQRILAEAELRMAFAPNIVAFFLAFSSEIEDTSIRVTGFLLAITSALLFLNFGHLRKSQGVLLLTQLALNNPGEMVPLYREARSRHAATNDAEGAPAEALELVKPRSAESSLAELPAE